MGNKRPSRPITDIDPETLHPLKQKKGRQRKPRNRPDPHPLNAAAKEASIERMKERSVAPGVMLEPAGDDAWKPTPVHNDTDLWYAQLGDAFGTSSQAVMKHFLFSLQDLCSEDWDPQHGWKTNETEWNAMLYMVADIHPRNTQEAALAAQMVAVHWLQMRLAKDALNRGGMVMEKSASLASKLARTYSEQLDTLRRLRGGKSDTVRQEIHVTKEEHVHYHDHRGAGQNDGRPQATGGEPMQYARLAPGCASVPSQGEVNGVPVQCSSREGQEGVQDARRKGRRPEG